MKIKDQILKIFSEHSGLAQDQIEPDFDLEKDLNLGQMERTDLFLKLEDVFKIKFEKKFLQRNPPVEEIVSYIIEATGEFEKET
jgi:acyl carrier protein